MKEFISISVFSVAFTFIILVNHILPINNSFINFKSDEINIEHKIISNENLASIIDYHKTNIAFAKRPATTFLIETLSNICSISKGLSFVLVNFFLFFLCGLLLYYLTQLVVKEKIYSYTTVGLFYVSFSVFFAFFDSIHTYDEPLQYFLILCSLIAFIKQKKLYFITIFTLSLIARESGLLLIPALLILTNKKDTAYLSKQNIKSSIYLFIPLLIYICFIAFYTNKHQISEASQSDFLNRLDHFNYNFQNLNFALESFTSLFVAIGFQTYIVIIYCIKNRVNRLETKMIKAFLITLFLNTLIVLIATKARETRLFTLPLFLIWPILGKFLIIEIKYFIEKNRITLLIKNEWFILTFSLIVLLEVLFYKFIYVSTVNAKGGSFQDEYFLIICLLISFHFLINLFSILKMKR